MALSRTSRILVAILLLAAAAFFWVNFFAQGPALVDEPSGTGTVAATLPTVSPPSGVALDAAEGDGAEEADVDGDASMSLAADAATAPVVSLEAPLTLSRNVVVADLPFLITEPPALVVDEAVDATADDASRNLAAARATVNPFSPVVMRVAEAPPREVPTAQTVITEVAVPAEPGVIPGPRITAPAPTVRAPAEAAVRDIPRALPSGTILSATPELLRQPRAPLERVDVSNVATIRVPQPEATAPEAAVTPRVTTAVMSTLPDVLGPHTPDAAETIAAVAGARPPLAAGTNMLSRYLRDNGYSFTGSALGPVSVGVFRSQGGPTPVVVAIGQTLPDTEIVLTALRGQQAELTLGDTSQILVLDLRR
ncbi:MAG: hypothetical protein H0U69_16195 [Trueperaceae bacterium]|nr:hypothetical protein [Trueperaceae bacterium]